MKTKPVYFKSDIDDARKWGRLEREKEILDEINLFEKHIKTQKQQDSYGDDVLEFKGVIKNIKELKKQIKEASGE